MEVISNGMESFPVSIDGYDDIPVLSIFCLFVSIFDVLVPWFVTAIEYHIVTDYRRCHWLTYHKCYPSPGTSTASNPWRASLLGKTEFGECLAFGVEQIYFAWSSLRFVKKASLLVLESSLYICIHICKYLIPHSFTSDWDISLPLPPERTCLQKAS